MNIDKTKVDHHSPKDKSWFYSTISNWHHHTKETLVAQYKNIFSGPNDAEEQTFLVFFVCLLLKSIKVSPVLVQLA